MQIKVENSQVKAIENEALISLIVPNKDYKIGAKAHLTTGFGRKYNKVAEKVCVSTQRIVIEPKHSINSSIVEIDYLMLSNKEILNLALNCGFSSLEEFYEKYNTKQELTLMNFTNKKY